VAKRRLSRVTAQPGLCLLRSRRVNLTMPPEIIEEGGQARLGMDRPQSDQYVAPDRDGPGGERAAIRATIDRIEAASSTGRLARRRTGGDLEPGSMIPVAVAADCSQGAERGYDGKLCVAHSSQASSVVRVFNSSSAFTLVWVKASMTRGSSPSAGCQNSSRRMPFGS